MYRKKGMERIQDNLLQDLERATTNLKNNPGSLGGWKVTKDPTQTTAYSTARVAKIYSPQYYVHDEPLYQNESMPRSNSQQSNDYAAINGRNSMPRNHQGQYHHDGCNHSESAHNGGNHNDEDFEVVVTRRGCSPNSRFSQPKQHVHVQEYLPRNRRPNSGGSGAVSGSGRASTSDDPLSQLDSLLEDLNATRDSLTTVTSESYQHPAAGPIYSTVPKNRSSPTKPGTPTYDHPVAYRSLQRRSGESDTQGYSPVNGNMNGYAGRGLANGDAQRPQYERQRSDSAQVNDLIKDLEYSLHSPTSTISHQHPHQQQQQAQYQRAPSPIKTQKSVTFTTNDGYTNGMSAANTKPAVQAKTTDMPGPKTARIQQVSEYNRNLVGIHSQQPRIAESGLIEVPLPHGSSNATKDLDDLMASLSDFKINQMKTNPKTANLVALGKIQVPSKNPGQLYPLRGSDQVDALDTMIGTIESDLNRQGVNVGSKGTCQQCIRPIVGQVVAAMGKTWHPEHFRCVKCNTELGEKTFFEREGMAYCEVDYHKLYSPQCAFCYKPILDGCITALDKTWHPEHFYCAHCGKNFGDEGYHEKGGSAYCKEDYFRLFAPKCLGCSNPIVENYVTALGGQWHQECFVCRDCNLPFNNGSYFDHEGKPYCEGHYHDKRGTLCGSCRQPIEGRCITAMGHKYHPEHFICSFCLKQLNKGTFKKHNEKPYCHSCFDKLFA